MLAVKKNTFISLFTAFIMLFSFCVPIVAEDVQPDENPMEKVNQYSNYMLKNMIKVYAHSIADNYYYGIDDDELLFAALCDTIDNNGVFDINRAIKAMIDCLKDEHAEFYTPEEFLAFSESVTGEFTGIGVVIYENDNGIVVLSTIEDSPARAAGILEGDYIVGIDGEDITGKTVTEVRNLIVGKTGSSVVVNIKRGGKVFPVECARAEVKVSQTETKMLSDDISYMRILQFTKTLPKEIEQHLEELKNNKISKLVIDLRNNPGGDLDAALEVANLLIGVGKLAELRYKNPDENKFLYSSNLKAPKLKIAVLVNENSASASEFLATAFQSRKAGKIIGTKTFGKGSMQVLTGLATNGGMKYTIGEFFAVNGERIHTVGITPDIEVFNEAAPVLDENFAPIDYELVEGASENAQMTLALEQRLEVLGYLEESADEVYDEKTTDAVKRLQNILGYEATGVAGFYEYLYLNDLSYDFETEKDNQLDVATDYLKNIR